MTQAAVWIDHQEARIFDIGADSFTCSTVRAHHAHTHRRHPETVDHEHPAETQRFLHDVASKLAHAEAILVLGPASAKHDLVHHIEKHDRQLASKVVGVETVDHPTDGQVADHARRFFSELGPPRVR